MVEQARLVAVLEQRAAWRDLRAEERQQLHAQPARSLHSAHQHVQVVLNKKARPGVAACLRQPMACFFTIQFTHNSHYDSFILSPQKEITTACCLRQVMRPASRTCVQHLLQASQHALSMRSLSDAHAVGTGAP